MDSPDAYFADEKVAVAGNEGEGYWGVRLLPPSGWSAQVIQLGRRAAGADPRTDGELRDLTRMTRSVTIQEPSDVRFLIVSRPSGSLEHEQQVGGFVATASGGSREGVLSTLRGAVSLAATAGAVVPTRFRFGQVVTSYNGPLFRVEGTSPTFATGGSSGASIATSVQQLGIRTLSLEIPAEASAPRVRVRVYGLNGQRIRDLVDDELQPGYYVVGWDGKDEAGRSVQPGVYVAVMTTDGFSATQRLIIR